MSVCGETRTRRRFQSFSLSTNEDIIDSARPDLTKALSQWRKTCQEEFSEAQYKALEYSIVTAWWERINAFDQRVLETARAWARKGNVLEGIRQAADIIVRLFTPSSQEVLHSLADIQPPQLAETPQKIEQEVVSVLSTAALLTFHHQLLNSPSVNPCN